jgi:Flp pilus assembly pilin Flp
MITFIAALMDLYRPLDTDRSGQSLVEYALIIVLVAIAVIAAMNLMSGQLSNVFSRISASLT